MDRIVTALIVAALLAVPVGADYYDPPPDWPGHPYFTHQQWEFSTSDNPSDPEPGYINGNGTPSALVGGDAFWIYDPSAYVQTDRRGMWVVGGFDNETSASLTLTIPNDPALPEKLVWLQITYFLAGAPGASYETDLITYGGEQISVIPGSEVAYPIDPVSEPDWYYYEKMWSIQPQPASETIAASIDLPAMAVFALDEAAVDTVCIPEPAACWLLALAAAGLTTRRAALSRHCCNGRL